MRISDRTIVALMMGTALLATPALAFDCAQISQPLVQPAPSITSKKPVPPASVPESAASSLSALQNAAKVGNADAQYDLARLYLKNADTSRDDFRYGARWLGLAAQKGQHQAQALLGQMLFDGDQLPRHAARGLMWLTLACECAGPEESWIEESYNRAMASASESDRATALQMLSKYSVSRRSSQCEQVN
jgi:TPR repeat protein